MAIHRKALSAGLAVLGLAMLAPGLAAAQRAPLQLVPQADSSKAPTRTTAPKARAKIAQQKNKTTQQNKITQPKVSNARSATAQPVARATAKKSATPTRTVARAPAAPPPARRTAAVAAPKSGAAPKAGAATKAVATTHARRTAITSPRRNHTATVRVAAPAPTLHRPARPAPASPAIVPPAADVGHVMHGADSVSLVARLPWWRNDRLAPVTYGSAEAESAVIAAADAWLAANGAEAAGFDTAGEMPARGPGDDAVEIADAGDLNDIDLAAAATNAPPEPTFLQSLMALLGSAAAAVARLLFV